MTQWIDLNKFFPIFKDDEKNRYEKWMADMILKAKANKASDLFFVSWEAPSLHYGWYCIKLKLWKPDENWEIKKYLKIQDNFILYFFKQFSENKLMKQKYEQELFITQFYTDLAIEIGETRFRVNFRRQQNKFTMTMRMISSAIPTVSELNLPPVFMEITNNSEWLILIAWPTWSWKSTSLAAILNELNFTKKKHIITLEDPIEYIYPVWDCLIEQKEINQDIVDFPGGVRASLRQKPDIILVWEMRDSATIEAVLKEAETWHLCFSTIHAQSVIWVIDKIINSFEWPKQLQIREQMADFLKAVFIQKLIPKKGGWKILCLEIAKINTAISNQIRSNDTTSIQQTISMSRWEGMILFDDYLLNLYKKWFITVETLQEFSRQKESNMKLAKEFMGK